jgi:type VI secretion system protein ImpA
MTGMALRDELLVPIPGANPAGAELRYDPVYDKIKEARREDDDAPQGEWQTERKVADWPLVIKLTKDALSKKSKDLQLAVWLTEAMLKREGLAGLRAGLDLLDGLVEQYWESLYPAVEDGDVEMRAAPLDWAGSRLDLAVRQAPANRVGHTFLQYAASRLIPSEAEAAEDDGRNATRAAAIADGKLTPEEFDQGFAATPKGWYKTLAADVASCIETLQRLDERSQERFGSDAPSFGKLRTALEEVQRATAQLLKRKLEVEPDPPEFNPAGVPASADIGPPPEPYFAPAPAVAASASASPSAARPPTAEAASREDAAARIVSAARFLRQVDPYNPASYLLLRGFRWGELRAAGQTVDPRLLEAPTTQVRTQLKTLLLDGKWKELIEACETVMGTPQGRGWLDLQRYALTACESLEAGYHFVARAIRAELRTLLAELPQLIDMTLMDDTPTANGETRAWLRTSVLTDGAAAAVAGANGDATGEADAEPRPRNARALAEAEARAGRAERGIAILTRELEREKTRRGRFLYQTQLAKIMVDAGHEAVAKPLLEELIASIETHRLEEWEAGDVIAQPLALLYRCLEKLDGDSDTKQGLYLRICRLDPLQAISFANGQQASQPQ